MILVKIEYLLFVCYQLPCFMRYQPLMRLVMVFLVDVLVCGLFFFDKRAGMLPCRALLWHHQEWNEWIHRCTQTIYRWITYLIDHYLLESCNKNSSDPSKLSYLREWPLHINRRLHRPHRFQHRLLSTFSRCMHL